MQVFVVVDSVENFEEKINFVKSYFSSDLKYFVKADLYPKICLDKDLLMNLCGVYTDSVNEKIDHYIRSEKYIADDCILYYTSMKLNSDIALGLREKLGYEYNSIYFEPKRNVFQKICSKLYKKSVQLMFNINDSDCIIKLQYMKKELMQDLISYGFNSRIVQINQTEKINIEDKEVLQSAKNKPKFNRAQIYNLIGLLGVLMLYVVCEKFFNLRFWAYTFFVLYVIMSIVMSLFFAVHHIFKNRVGRK